MPYIQRDIFLDPTRDLPRFDLNPYVQELVQGENEALPALYGEKLRGKKGRWRDFFAQSLPGVSQETPLYLEVGCHKGQCLIEMAKDHPDRLYIGLDITFKRVVLTARRAKEQGVKNLITVLGDAKNLPLLFSDLELSGVIVFFPDPWIKKKKQAGKRLLSLDFCRSVQATLAIGAGFWFKTDHKPYFDEVSAYLTDLNLKESQAQGLFEKSYTSVFEQKFKMQGLPTYETLRLKA